MHVHFGVELLNAEWPHSVVCIGTFDGVHLGHQEVIRHAVNLAHSKLLPCVLVTFDRHPAAILAPERCPPAIATLQSNLAHFSDLGVAVAVVLPFDKALSETSAETFFNSILVGKLKAEAMVLGHDFAFGKGRQGTPEWLKQRIETDLIPPFTVAGKRVSSSEIRTAVSSGEVAHAEELLGRPFEIPGIVVKGDQLGRTLGYPTVNLARSVNQVLPSDGVYGGQCQTSLGKFKAAISIGKRPTVGGEHRTIEAFLLDYPGDALYGQPVVLQFERYLRKEEHFESLEALKEQMAKDILAVSGVV